MVEDSLFCLMWFAVEYMLVFLARIHFADKSYWTLTENWLRVGSHEQEQWNWQRQYIESI